MFMITVLRHHSSLNKTSVTENNIQDGNVGNRGDILKHAILVQLARLLKTSSSNHFTYLESHCYLYHSFLANNQWQSDIKTYLKTMPFVDDYYQLESAHVTQGQYLCSSGLVHQVIPEAEMLLCEHHAETRNKLVEQLKKNSATYTLFNQIEDIQSDHSSYETSTLLALIDPFNFTDELWNTTGKVLQKILCEDAAVLMLVFDYRENEPDWSDNIAGLCRLAATVSDSPYHLAVYSTEKLYQSVRDILHRD